LDKSIILENSERCKGKHSSSISLNVRLDKDNLYDQSKERKKFRQIKIARIELGSGILSEYQQPTGKV
jgi:hypothetical protein